MDRDPPTRLRRKLLVASIGVATVSYAILNAACDRPTTGNLPAPPPSMSPVTGNLPAPPPTDAAGPSTATPPPSATGSGPPTTGVTPISGNLPAPPPQDAGKKNK